MRIMLLNSIVIAGCVILASGTVMDSNMTSKLYKDISLFRLHPSILEKCLNTCLNNTDCQSVVYTRLANFCELQSTYEPAEEQSNRRGIVINRSDIEKRLLGQPSTNYSQHNYRTVCPLSEFAEFKRLGNRNRRGDRVIIVNYGNDTSKCSLAAFVCGELGEWVPTNCSKEAISTVTANPRDCNDVGLSENTFSGIYEIFPADSHGPINVFCDFYDTDGPWTVIQRRVDGSVDFYRNFTEYQDGFGELRGNFWLGLDHISSITLQRGRNYSLKIIVIDTVNGIKFAKYSRFQVKNASTGYKLQVRAYSGNAGNSLSYHHHGLPFSTYDNDMDTNVTGNCAILYTGAWWYTNCHVSNLNGKYGDSRYGKGINWLKTTGYYRSATFATMKIKRGV